MSGRGRLGSYEHVVSRAFNAYIDCVDSWGTVVLTLVLVYYIASFVEAGKTRTCCSGKLSPFLEVCRLCNDSIIAISGAESEFTGMDKISQENKLG